MQAAAAASRVPIAVADRAGAERMNEEIGSDWVGGSLIAGADGYPLTAPALGQAALRSACIDLSASANKRWAPLNDAFADRKPQHYRLSD